MATYREDDADPKEQFVYHAAGNDGRGTASYIDDVILRDKDANTDWDVQADGTLEERIYYMHNWRHDVIALVDANGGGMQVENIRYEAYGIPFLVVAGDVNVDGQRKTADYTAIQNLIDTMGYDILADVDLDGDVDATDKSIVQGLPIFGGGGRGVLSHPDDYNRKGYAGYEFDNTITHASYHVRYRVLNSTLGQWTRRDPLGYMDGANLFEYTNNPIVEVDSAGLLSCFECRLIVAAPTAGACWVICGGFAGPFCAILCGPLGMILGHQLCCDFEFCNDANCDSGPNNEPLPERPPDGRDVPRYRPGGGTPSNNEPYAGIVN